MQVVDADSGLHRKCVNERSGVLLKVVVERSLVGVAARCLVCSLPEHLYAHDLFFCAASDCPFAHICSVWCYHSTRCVMHDMAWHDVLIDLEQKASRLLYCTQVQRQYNGVRTPMPIHLEIVGVHTQHR